MNPISYSIDTSLGVIFETWDGTVTADDLHRHWDEYLDDPEVLALRKTLVDLRKADIQFTGTELCLLVSASVIPRLDGRDWKTAIVVDAAVQFGVSRQYHVFARSYSKDSIFHDRDEALRWLCSNKGRPLQSRH